MPAAPSASSAAPAPAAPLTAPPTSALHPRDLLRQALGELGTLSAELTAANADLERTRVETTAATDKFHGKATWDADERARTGGQAATAEHAKKSDAARTDRTTSESTAKRRHTDAIATAKRHLDEQSAAIKKAIRDREWEADALLEGAETAAKQRTKEAAAESDKALADLAEREARTIATLDLYGQSHLVLAAPPSPAPIGDEVDERHARTMLAERLANEETLHGRLASLAAARMFVGIRPYLIGLALIAGGAVGGYLLTPGGGVNPTRIGLGAGAGLLAVCALALLGKVSANRRIRATYAPLRQALEDAKALAAAVLDRATERINSDLNAARLKRDLELKSIRDRHAPMKEKATATHNSAVEAAEAELRHSLTRAVELEKLTLTDLDAAHGRRMVDLDARRVHDLAEAGSATAKRRAALDHAHAAGRAALQQRWRDGLSRVAAATHTARTTTGAPPIPWDRTDWPAWTPPRTFPPAIGFGTLDVDAHALIHPHQPPATEGAAPAPLADSPWSFEGLLPPQFTVPAFLAYGERAAAPAGSLLLDFDRDGRAPALAALRNATAHLLASMPPGRARLTLVDPVGLGQTFAGFMHLADYDEALTGPRIWTDQEQIDRRLQDLTDHMETVIQKYLRNEFETIDAYNAQAGELAEPYRFLVAADFPTAFSPEALKKLTSILHSGAKCGVHVLLARDVRIQMERRVLDDIRGGVTVLDVPAAPEKSATWTDPVFGRFPLTLSPEPSDAALTALCQQVGEGAKRANRVEVDVRALLPTPAQRWSASAAAEFTVPIGRSGATRLQQLRLGRGVSQHGLLAGKTGSGKSTLLHVLTTNAAQWFTPAEVEFYLIDFKKGVEFKAYADHELPHVKAVAIESDREFGLSILQRLDAELTRRGELYRRAAVQDLASYREAQPNNPMPRILLIVDEFQEFFSEDDKLAQEAASLIDRLVRQGRAFGMHVLLGSQTIGGATGLPRATLGQMAVRVALQCSEADSTMILGESNTAARLLSRPGEAIYNDNGGLPEANSPFQVAWLPDETRDRLLEEVAAEGRKRGWTTDAVVFEGNKPASISANRELPTLQPGGNLALLGEPVAIKPTTRAPFRRQPGSNMLLIGQQEEAAMATLQAALLSLARSAPPNLPATFTILEGTNQDSPLRNALAQLPLPNNATLTPVDYRAAEEAIATLHAELQRRTADPDAPAPPQYLVIYALQRYRALRRTDSDYSFSMSDEPKKVSPDKMLADLAREGPPLGIHLLAWADTLANIERTFDRALMREFDYRVLFQMSATDSSALIDSPAANRLGPVRALLFSEEQGTLEKFRPFAPLPPRN